MVAGFVLVAGGLAWFAQVSPNGTYVGTSCPSLLAAVGLGLVFVPLTIAAVAGAPPRVRARERLINTSRGRRRARPRDPRHDRQLDHPGRDGRGRRRRRLPRPSLTASRRRSPSARLRDPRRDPRRGPDPSKTSRVARRRRPPRRGRLAPSRPPPRGALHARPPVARRCARTPRRQTQAISSAWIGRRTHRSLPARIGSAPR